MVHNLANKASAVGRMAGALIAGAVIEVEASLAAPDQALYCYHIHTDDRRTVRVTAQAVEHREPPNLARAIQGAHSAMRVDPYLGEPLIGWSGSSILVTWQTM